MKKVAFSVLVFTFVFVGLAASAMDNPQTKARKTYRMIKSESVQTKDGFTRQIFTDIGDFATKEECQAEIKKQMGTNPTDESSYGCKRIAADGLLDPSDLLKQ